MEFIKFYALSIVGTILVGILFAGLTSLQSAVKPLLWKLHYPYIPSISGKGSTTRLGAVLIFLVCTINAFCVLWGPRIEAGGVARRSAALSIANLIGTLVGARMNIVVDLCGVGLTTLSCVHRLMGRLVWVHACVHVGIAILGSRSHLEPLQYISGLLAAIILTILLLSAQAQRWSGALYELFVNAHLGLTISLIVALALHAWLQLKNMIVICICALVLSWTLKLGQWLYPLLVAGRATNIQMHSLTYYDTPVDDASHVSVSLPRKMDIYPGQYVYVRVSGISPCSIVQSHPFYVFWSEEEQTNGMKLFFLVQKRRGLTELLQPYCGKKPRQIFLEGPFGKRIDLSPRQMMFFCATGVGIAAVLPFIKYVIDNHSTEGRKLRVYWVVDKQVQLAWATEFITRLLSQDIHKDLRFKLFIHRDSLPHKERSNRLRFYNRSNGYWEKETHERGEKMRVVTIEGLIAEKIEKQRKKRSLTHRRSLVLMCTDVILSKNIRSTVAGYTDVYAHELAFQPDCGGNDSIETVV